MKSGFVSFPPTNGNLLSWIQGVDIIFALDVTMLLRSDGELSPEC